MFSCPAKRTARLGLPWRAASGWTYLARYTEPASRIVPGCVCDMASHRLAWFRLLVIMSPW
jgi:hypothetical protein